LLALISTRHTVDIPPIAVLSALRKNPSTAFTMPSVSEEDSVSDSGNDPSSDADDLDSLLDESSNTGSSGRSPSAARTDKVSNEEEIKQLSARETQTIRCWRIIVLLLIAVVGAAVAAGASHFLKSQEERKYKDGVSA
jgi:hypothetical protein